jgi:uncharacterized C2H2 Zn-finger protein
MLPKIHARFRRFHGVPYAIERLSGKQFRCRHCNKVFFSEKELQRHIAVVQDHGEDSNHKVAQTCPALSSSISLSVLYTYDLWDRMKKEWLKLRPGEIYDGL